MGARRHEAEEAQDPAPGVSARCPRCDKELEFPPMQKAQVQYVDDQGTASEGGRCAYRANK
jgi:hypothetical protein